MQGERQEQFFDRASRALQKSIPSVNRRTVEILQLWKESPEAVELNEKAESRFTPDEYTHFGPRCIFLEHIVPAMGESEEIPYGRDNLLKLVNWANHRIADSETFAAISEGHTPSEEERAAGHEMPEVLGYSGPFYLGLLGDREPKWAIYSDEWVHNADLEKFKKLQRRSPEVWCSEPMERRTMDPIAALGAETPRLDSGMNAYCRAGDGKTVMRYSAAGGPAVMPGPTNTYIPSGERRNTVVDYSGGTMDLPGAAPAKPDLGTVIANAFMAIIPSIAQAINQAMSTDPADDTTEPGDTPRGMEPEPEVPVEEPVAPEVPAAPAEPADPDDDKYKAMGADCYAAYSAGKAKSKYSKRGEPAVDASIHATIAKLQKQILDQKAEIDGLKKVNSDTVRYHKRSQTLAGLSQEYTFDPAEELETTNDLNDEQFTRHCEKVVTKYSKRDDVTAFTIFDDPTVPTDTMDRSLNGKRISEAQIQRYSRQAQDRAVQKNGMSKKPITTFEAEYAAILKEHGVAV